MESLDTIQKVDQRASSILVAAEKPKGKLRVCFYPKT